MSNRPMRRCFRIAFNTLTVLSLVLAILVAGLWVRSHWKLDILQRQGIVSFAIVSDEGKLAVLRSEFRGMQLQHRWSYETSASGISLVSGGYGFPKWWFAGFTRGGRTWSYPLASRTDDRHDYLIVPSWAAIAVALLLPARWAQNYRRRRARLGHSCPTCGYDLRATPDRCPECATVPSGAISGIAGGQ